MLELKGLSYQVEDNGAQTDILRGIDLTIDNNKFVVITGPNGGGKTTLAKAIMGLVPRHGRADPVERTGHHQAFPSPSGPSWASATASSSPPALRACGSGTCWPWPPATENLSRDECCSSTSTGSACAPPIM